MIVVWYFFIFFLGAAIGSFLNVLVSRTVSGDDWIKGRSRCDHCQETLEWYDMIPLFSFVAYRGKSRCCHKRISYQHPMVELMTGLLFLWWALMGSFFFHLLSHPLLYIQPLFWLFMGLVLLTIFIMDLFYGLIPVSAVIVGSVGVVLYRFYLATSGVYKWSDFGLMLLSAVLAYVIFFLIRRATHNRGMGEGDVILSVLLGLVTGWPRVVPALWLSFVVGAIVGVLLMLVKKKKMKQILPFGPFMIVGILLALVWGEQLLQMVL